MLYQPLVVASYQVLVALPPLPPCSLPRRPKQAHRLVTQWDLCGTRGVSSLEEDKQRIADGNLSIFWSNLSPTYCNLLKI